MLYMAATLGRIVPYDKIREKFGRAGDQAREALLGLLNCYPV